MSITAHRRSAGSGQEHRQPGDRAGRRPTVQVTYHTTTNRYLEDQGITVVPVVGAELGRGRGGPRCLTCPISREA